MNAQSESTAPRPASPANPQSPSTANGRPAPQTSGPGRPRVLNEFKRGQIHALVAGGCSLRDAAHYIGCSFKTIRREVKRDADFKNSSNARSCTPSLVR